MSTLEFTGKASTLECLNRVLRSARTLPVYRFTVKQFLDHPWSIIEHIQTRWPHKKVAVRSSAFSEDAHRTSLAGHFQSVLDVNTLEYQRLESAIERVVTSFDKHDYQSEVFIQPMVQDITMSGVVLTADLDTLAPYYSVDYDCSGKADSVTSGSQLFSTCYIQFKRSPVPCADRRIARLLETAKELEGLFNYPYLDIEFALNRQDELYILQVRPIARSQSRHLTTLPLEDTLTKIYKKIAKLSQRHPNLLGSKAIFGVMPDWNPAEIIGMRPRPLALSLYKELITDSIWAYQRDNYGYRNLRSHPLLISYVGLPYIDVRVDFNSFIPADLDETIAEKLVDYYLTCLEDKPYYHDKVEFNIVHSCYHFSLPQRLKELLHCGFNENEIKRIEFSLLRLTNNIMAAEGGYLQEDLDKLSTLTERYQAVMESDLSIVDKIYWLAEDCKRYGTLPFAGIARAAFIATQYLNSFVDLKILSQEQREQFMSSLQIVSSDLQRDLQALFEHEAGRAHFMETYGHLRPGTYDILSPRYDEQFDHFFSRSQLPVSEKTSFVFSAKQRMRIQELCREHGLLVDAGDLIRFIRKAIEGREYAKLVFTKSVSQILVQIEKLGEQNQLSREQCSFLDFGVVRNLYANLDARSVFDIFDESITFNRYAYQYTNSIKLPLLIRRPEDVYGFYVESSKPNFITHKRIQSETAVENARSLQDVAGKTVFIRSADPGYDYLFTRDIAGLVTQFGGANSHMAIRCAELGIPAVIGAGDQLFTEWSKARILDLDCENKCVRVVV